MCETGLFKTSKELLLKTLLPKSLLGAETITVQPYGQDYRHFSKKTGTFKFERSVRKTEKHLYGVKKEKKTKVEVKM